MSLTETTNMAETIVELLTDVADAIREKKRSNEPINAQNFAEEIRTIESGGETKYEFGETMVDNNGNGYMTLRNVTILDGIEDITRFAYYNSNIVSVMLPSSVKKISHGCFSGCLYLETINLNYVTLFEQSCFYNCSKLTSIQLNNDVKEIPYEGFQNCTGLQNMVLPSNLNRINDYAFKNCTFTQIVIPVFVNEIRNQAFNSCKQLSKVVVMPETPPTLGPTVFDNNAIDRLIYVPDNSVDAYKSATNWSAYADYIRPISEIPNE